VLTAEDNNFEERSKRKIGRALTWLIVVAGYDPLTGRITAGADAKWGDSVGTFIIVQYQHICTNRHSATSHYDATLSQHSRRRGDRDDAIFDREKLTPHRHNIAKNKHTLQTTSQFIHSVVFKCGLLCFYILSILFSTWTFNINV